MSGCLFIPTDRAFSILYYSSLTVLCIRKIGHFSYSPLIFRPHRMKVYIILRSWKSSMHDEVSVLNILNGNLLIIRKSKIKLVDSSSSKCIQLLIVNVDSTVIEMRLHHLHTTFSCKENVALKMREKFSKMREKFSQLNTGKSCVLQPPTYNF